MHTIVFLDRASLDATLRAPVFPHVWRNHDATAPEEMRCSASPTRPSPSSPSAAARQR
jgi:hypothetical protein